MKRFIQGDNKVLDIGANANDYHKHFIKINPENMYAIDIDNSNYKTCKNFIKGNAENMHEFKDNFFNYIIAGDVIEHLHNPFIFLKECYRVLKPEGKLLIITPNARVNPISYNLIKNMKEHLYFWDLPNLTRLIKSAGFHVFERGYIVSKLFYLIMFLFPFLSLHMYVFGTKGKG
jgi:ubiquinone/menaquinone biosynthesis C-methylase UbiE